jgi:hypothetical protein
MPRESYSGMAACKPANRYTPTAAFYAWRLLNRPTLNQWDVDAADAFHPLLTLLLLLQQFALACNVAAVAFGGNILAQSGHALMGMILQAMAA